MLPTETEKLAKIQHEILVLGEIVLETNQQILDALKECQPCKIDEISKIKKQERYSKIDEIDDNIIKFFALYTPEARDLRQLIAFLKMTNEFDRIANSCNSFIRDFPRALSDDVDKDFILEYAIPLQKTSISALKSALKLIELDDKEQVEEEYKNVVVEEGKNDELYQIIEKNLLKKININLTLSQDYQDIMQALRRLEKVADRALSIASLMHYAKLGGTITKA
ncbi:MAG: PhoU family transcriptional regulator [Gammaproteobacteria bacterium]|nr:PhoU family transcriptional regulator [Gammaproteobacteria bacterium]